LGREDDVKFFGLCEARGIPGLHIGVTDYSGLRDVLDIAIRKLGDLGATHKGTFAELFG
jgi:phosphoribosylformylglycinamidine synthase